MGVAPNKIEDVFGIFKAYTTRVGSGPFPTELFDETGEQIAKVGNEFGATTGRPRCGWLDLVALKYTVQVNGVTQLMMMKSDAFGIDKLKICTSYDYRGNDSSLAVFTKRRKPYTKIHRDEWLARRYYAMYIF